MLNNNNYNSLVYFITFIIHKISLFFWMLHIWFKDALIRDHDVFSLVKLNKKRKEIYLKLLWSGIAWAAVTVVLWLCIVYSTLNDVYMLMGNLDLNVFYNRSSVRWIWSLILKFCSNVNPVKKLSMCWLRDLEIRIQMVVRVAAFPTLW